MVLCATVTLFYNESFYLRKFYSLHQGTKIQEREVSSVLKLALIGVWPVINFIATNFNALSTYAELGVIAVFAFVVSSITVVIVKTLFGDVNKITLPYFVGIFLRFQYGAFVTFVDTHRQV